MENLETDDRRARADWLIAELRRRAAESDDATERSRPAPIRGLPRPPRDSTPRMTATDEVSAALHLLNSPRYVGRWRGRPIHCPRCWPCTGTQPSRSAVPARPPGTAT